MFLRNLVLLGSNARLSEIGIGIFRIYCRVVWKGGVRRTIRRRVVWFARYVGSKVLVTETPVKKRESLPAMVTKIFAMKRMERMRRRIIDWLYFELVE